MCIIPNKTGSDSTGESSWEDRSFDFSSSRKNNDKELIRQANQSVLLSEIFGHYGLRADPSNHKMTCPFPAHKGGRETTASFLYYPQTNSFNCFGCHIGGGCSEFVANKENISRVKAAIKILDLFSGDLLPNENIIQQNFSERLEIMLDFSTAVRDFRQEHCYDEKSVSFIEHICSVYDAMNSKRNKLDNEALRWMVQKLNKKIKSYIP